MNTRAAVWVVWLVGIAVMVAVMVATREAWLPSDAAKGPSATVEPTERPALPVYTCGDQSALLRTFSGSKASAAFWTWYEGDAYFVCHYLETGTWGDASHTIKVIYQTAKVLFH